MMIRKATCGLMMATSFALAGQATAAHVLTNPGFESVLEYGDANASNWFAFFGAGSTGTFSTVDAGYSGPVMPNEGSHHLSIANDGTAQGFSGVQQDVAVVAGTDYTFSVSALANGPFVIGAEIRIEWIDAGGATIGDPFANNTSIAGALTGSYQEFSVTDTAPVGAVEGRAVIAVETFSASGSPGGNLFVDSADFDVVPEPGSLALLGLGGLALLRRRR